MGKGGWLCMAGLLLVGCFSPLRSPDLGHLYNRSARYHAPERNPVIVIPGFIGSRLIEPESGKVIWGSFDGQTANPEDPADARLVALPLTENQPWAEIEAAGVLDRFRAKFLGLPLQLKAYAQILALLGAAGYRDQELGEAGVIDYGDDHFTCFQFAYDWRYGSAVNARRLHEFILEKKVYVQREIRERFGIERDDIRFDVIAHSMGGLVTRYYLRYGAQALPEDGSLPELNWAGAKHVDRAILIAPPNGGTAKAVVQLVNGVRYAPTKPRYRPALVGTFPAGYQMLPRERHGMVVDKVDTSSSIGDLLDPELWERLGWGLASPGEDDLLQMLLPGVDAPEERRRIALNVQRRNLRWARQVQQALDVPAEPPPGTDLYLIAGDAVKTPSRIGVDMETGEIEILETAPGDGSVLRSSALLDERVGGYWQPTLVSPIAWRDVLFLFASHLQMTSDAVFSDNLLYRLLEEPRRSHREGEAR